MSDNELSETELIGLLGTYADALEKHATIAPQPERVDEITIQQSGADAPAEGAEEMSDEQMGEQPEVIELDVVPTAKADPGRGRMLLVAAGVAVVALVGAMFALNNDATELESTPVAEEAEADDVAEDAEAPAEESAEDASDEATEAATDMAAASSVVGFGGPGSVVYANGEYVSIGGSPDGAVVSRSSNGTDWTSQTIDAFPEDSVPTQLVEVDGTWVTVVEVWPQFDIEDEPAMYFPEERPERFVGTSTDLENWNLADFPDIEVEDGEFAYVSGLAASGDRLAISVEVQPSGIDEFAILLENDLLTSDQLESMCGSEYTEGGDFVFYGCDFDELAEPDAETTPTTVMPAETEILRVSPGDPGYDELEANHNSYSSDADLPETTVLSGPIDGPFESAELPISGFGTRLVGTDAGFVALASGFEGQSSAASSVDGVTWTEAADLPLLGVSTATAFEGNVFVVGQGADAGPNSFVAVVSDDLGATWTESVIPTALFAPWGEIVGGPAGVAIRLEGSTDEDAADFNPFGDMDPVSITTDGYTMTMDLTDGTATLTDPDGVLIHELPETAFMEDGVEGIARFEGPYQETIIWLDPATGDDLVSFTQQQMEAVFDEIMPEFDEEAMFDDMSRASETWFSADGITWTMLDSGESNMNDSYTMVVAVGDTEVLVRSEEFVQPPSELFAFEDEGREPTAEEEEALDAYFMDQTNTSEWIAIPLN